MPTEDNLCCRGCIVVSICSLCGITAESTSHLFFDCSYSNCLWSWLSDMLNLQIDSLDIDSVLSICNRGWSTQALDVVVARIINVLGIIWYSRNQAKFNSKCISLHSVKVLVISNVSLYGNSSRGIMSTSVSELVMMKGLWVNGHPSKAPRIKQVTWYPPICNTIKCNCDGAAKGFPGPAGCGGIFRDKSAAILGCYADNLGTTTCIFAEFIGAMLAVEIAFNKGWINLWLECDSQLVVLAFKDSKIVPWRLRNICSNCIDLTKRMSFRVSRIYREDNSYADKLANHGTLIDGFIWWDLALDFI